MTGGHEALFARGKEQIRRGALAEGIELLLGAAAELDGDERSATAVYEELRRAYELVDAPRAAATVLWALRRSPGPSLSLPPVDHARTRLLSGDHAGAAAMFEAAGLLAHAAVARERAGDRDAARALWARLAHRLARPDDTGRVDPAAAAERRYVLGLVHYDVARNSVAQGGRTEGQGRSAREAIVGAVVALEEAATRFEALGMRERAFDCHNAVAAIGETTGAFEHVLEGRVNAIRILREDHLQQYALQQLDDAIAVAAAAGEPSAAAVFARDALAYARAIGRADLARTYAGRAVDLHVAAGRALLAAGAPAELAEPAFVAAIALAADAGLLGRARAIYEEAAALPGLDEIRRARHLRGAMRLAHVAPAREEKIDASKARSSPLEVWIVDVLEWEQAGRAEEACAEIILERRGQADRRPQDDGRSSLERRAILARLWALHAAAAVPASRALAAKLGLVRRLGEIADYRVLAPLEHLARDPSAEVRERVAEAAAVLPFKRSAQILRRLAADPDPAVVAAVARGVARKQGAVFVDTLRRIHAEAASPEIRAAAIRALVAIDNVEAATTVLDVLEVGTGAERAAALEALRRRRSDRGTRLVALARERLARGVSAEVEADLAGALGIRS
jgi:hypothetical protein